MDASSTVSPTAVGVAVSSIATEALTFGLELEFNLIIHENEIPPEFEESLHLKPFIGCLIVHRALSEEAVPVFGVDGEKTIDLQWWTSLYEGIGNGLHSPRCTNAQLYSKWTLEPDISVQLRMEELPRLPADFQVFSVELKSRIFSVLEDDWAGEISRVLQILKTKFNGDNGSSIRLVTNRNAGLHVHVGKAATDGSPARFDIRTVKNLFQLVTAFERQIDELHTSDRISGVDPYCAVYCRPPSQGFRDLYPNNTNPLLSAANLKDGTPLTWCGVIEGVVHQLQDLYTLTRNDRVTAFNFRHTTPMVAEWDERYEAARRWTVECRQHRGTLDADEIFAWLGFLLATFQYAVKTPHDAIRRLIEQRVEDPHFFTADLLEIIGVPAAVVSYYKDVAGRDSLKLVEAGAEEANEAVDPREKLQQLADSGAGFETQLRDLLTFLATDRLITSSHRREAISEKLEARLYGNFAPEVQARFLEAMVPKKPWAGTPPERALNRGDDAEVEDVEFAPEVEGVPRVYTALREQAIRGFGQIIDLEDHKEGDYV